MIRKHTSLVWKKNEQYIESDRNVTLAQQKAQVGTVTIYWKVLFRTSWVNTLWVAQPFKDQTLEAKRINNDVECLMRSVSQKAQAA